MNRRGALALAGALLVPPTVLAQGPAPIRGRVVDAGTGAPVSGARITAALARIHAEADAEGRFRLGLAAPDTLVAGAIGYRPGRLAVLPGDTALRLALRPMVAELSDLVVTAGRRMTRAGETAVAVHTLGRADLVAAAAASVDRVLAREPGIQVLPQEPAGADISIRGINGPRVLVLVDGEPTAGNLLENRDLSRLSTLALDRIEVVKGPLSAVYGSDALGGVVNLVTRDPAGPLRLETTGRLGGQGRREASLSAQAGGAVAFRADGGWREERQVPSVVRAEDALARVWDARVTARALLGSVLFRGDVGGLRERQRWRLSADGFNGFNDNRGATGWIEALWTMAGGSIRTRAYGEDYRHRFRQARGADPLATDSAPAQRERVLKASTGWDRRIGSHALLLGFDLAHRSIEAPGKVDGTLADDQLEGYAQDGWTVGKLLVTPSARISWNSRWGTAFTPSLAAAWDVAPVWRVRAGLARGFRGPSVKELAWDFPNPFAGYVIRGNPSLVPERSWQVFAGATWAAAPELSLDVEAYRNDLRDLIELENAGTDPATSLLVFSPRNVARARTQGVEAEVRWSRGGWTLAAGYNYLDAVDRETGARLDRRAAQSALLRMSRTAAWLAGVRADAVLAYTGPAPAVLPDGSTGRQAAFAALGGQLQVDAAPWLGVSLGVENALDARPEGWTGLYGRRFFLGLRGTWLP